VIDRDGSGRPRQKLQDRDPAPMAFTHRGTGCWREKILPLPLWEGVGGRGYTGYSCGTTPPPGPLPQGEGENFLPAAMCECRGGWRRCRIDRPRCSDSDIDTLMRRKNRRPLPLFYLLMPQWLTAYDRNDNPRFSLGFATKTPVFRSLTKRPRHWRGLALNPTFRPIFQRFQSGRQRSSGCIVTYGGGRARGG